MVAPVEFLPSALAEAEAAATWYAKRSSRAAADFSNELDVALNRIAGAPLAWPVHLHGTRRISLRRFPFLIVYRVASKRILVVAVAHGRRRPGYWRTR